MNDLFLKKFDSDEEDEEYVPSAKDLKEDVKEEKKVDVNKNKVNEFFNKLKNREINKAEKKEENLVEKKEEGKRNRWMAPLIIVIIHFLKKKYKKPYRGIKK